jgi:DNA-binding NarL/FixJ family response regulator
MTTSVFIASPRTEERSALRLLFQEMKILVLGEAADWTTTLKAALSVRFDVLVVDADMLPRTPSLALEALRNARAGSLAIILISPRDAYQQAAVSSGADFFVSKSENAERVADRFRILAGNIQGDQSPATANP